MQELCQTCRFSELKIRSLSSWSINSLFVFIYFISFIYSCSIRYEFPNWMVFPSEMVIIFMLDKLQFEVHMHPSVDGKNSLRCAGACLVLRSRCVSLSCVFQKGLHMGGCWGMSSFMLLTNKSLRPRLKPAVQQTNTIIMTKVCGRMQYDKGMVAIKRHPLISHTLILGQT